MCGIWTFYDRVYEVVIAAAVILWGPFSSGGLYRNGVRDTTKVTAGAHVGQWPGDRRHGADSSNRG